MEKRILLTPSINEDEPPPGLKKEAYFKRIGILNPAVKQEGDRAYLFSRLIYKDESGLNSCIVRHSVYIKNGELRVEKDRRGLPLEELVFPPEKPFGDRGVEDFRFCKVKGEMPYHGFLVNFNGIEARTEYLRTFEKDPENLSRWEKFGIYFPNIRYKEALDLVGNSGDGVYKKVWYAKYKELHTLKDRVKHLPNKAELNLDDPFLPTKDCSYLPLKIEGKKGIILRLLPDIQLAFIDDAKELATKNFWQNLVSNIDDYILLKRKFKWEESHIGLSGPPFEIEEGIILPYHGARMRPFRDYRFGLALLDKDNPKRVLARTPEPILYPTEKWEENGVVSGKVVFPTGHLEYKNRIYLLYGAADKYIAYCSFDKKEFFSRLFRQ